MRSTAMLHCDFKIILFCQKLLNVLKTIADAAGCKIQGVRKKNRENKKTKNVYEKYVQDSGMCI